MNTIDRIKEILIIDFNPHFLAFDFFDDNVNVIMSADCFINQSMPNRIKSVYKVVRNKCPEIFDEYGFFVYTFTEEELYDVLEILNPKEGN